MPIIGTLTTFSASTLAKSAEVNTNFSDIKTVVNTYCVLTDVARTVTVTHTFSASQTFSAGIALTGSLTMATAASKIVPGATSLSLRNNADSADNLILTDAGAATIRAGLTVTTGGITATGNSTITGTLGGVTTLTCTTVTATNLGGTLSTAAQANVTSVGTLTALTVSGLSTLQKATFSSQYGPSAAYALTDGATIALDWNNGNVQMVTLGGNRTFTFANPVSGGRYIIRLLQDATGSRTVTWPTIKWTGGAAPTLTTTANKKDVITLIYDGTDYIGGAALNA